MATKEVDFSFPVTTNSPPRFIGSQPLWQVAALSASCRRTPVREDGTSKGFSKDNNFRASSPNSLRQRRSLSQIEDCRKMMKIRSPHDVDIDDDEEEKMDVLWEDFNEEFSSRKLKSRMSDDFDAHGNMSPKGMANMGCGRSLKLSKSSKKPSLVAFVKVLKKFLSLQNSHRSLRKRD